MVRNNFHSERLMRTIRQNVRVGVVRAGIIVQTEAKKMLNRGASNRGATPSAPGQPPHKDTGTLGRSIQIDASDIGEERNAPKVRVGTNLPYAAIHEFGGVIRPKRSRFLTVPIGQNGRNVLRRGGLRSVPGVFFIKTKRGGVMAARQYSKAKAAALEPLAILVTEVRMPRRPYMRPAVAKAKKPVLAQFTIDRMLNGWVMP